MRNNSQDIKYNEHNKKITKEKQRKETLTKNALTLTQDIHTAAGLSIKLHSVSTGRPLRVRRM